MSATRQGQPARWIPIAWDSRGRPEVSVWRIPRILASGVIVWRERGRYRVMRELCDNTFAPAGSWHATMIAVRAELHALGVLS